MKRKIFIIICLFMILIPRNIVAQDTITVEELENIEEAGTYFVRIYTQDLEGNTISKVVAVTITFARTMIDKGEGIDARDFRLTQEEFDEMNEAKWVQKANAHAWIVETGDVVPVKFVRLETVVEGMNYRAYFKTEKGLETFAFVQIVDEDGIASSLKPLFINPSSTVTSRYNLQVLSGLIALLLLPIIIVMLIYFVLWKRIKLIYELLVEEE